MSLSEQERKKALEAYRTQFPESTKGLSDDDLIGDGDRYNSVNKVKAWLRACEWMHEYATREAYKEAERICAAEEERMHLVDPYYGGRMVAKKLKEEFHVLANESSGKGEKR